MELGVVDPNGPLDDQVEAMDLACRSRGFFRIPLDVVAPSIRDDAWHTAAAFFALDDAAKREIEFPEPGYPYGYSPFRAETLAKSLDDDVAAPDLK
ncbi:MAG: 2-oxoglutarate and iron-dependent oxygenase domain-containing protein [Actinomycetota bacterium]